MTPSLRMCIWRSSLALRAPSPPHICHTHCGGFSLVAWPGILMKPGHPPSVSSTMETAQVVEQAARTGLVLRAVVPLDSLDYPGYSQAGYKGMFVCASLSLSHAHASKRLMSCGKSCPCARVRLMIVPFFATQVAARGLSARAHWCTCLPASLRVSGGSTLAQVCTGMDVFPASVCVAAPCPATLVHFPRIRVESLGMFLPPLQASSWPRARVRHKATWIAATPLGVWLRRLQST